MGKKYYDKKTENKFIDEMNKPKLGAPTMYTEELADKIIYLIETQPMSMFDLIQKFDLPNYGTVNRWLKEKPIFRERYECAKLEAISLHVEFTNKIADDTIELLDGCDKVKASAYVAASKLRIESRQWQAQRLMPLKFSDKVRQEEAEKLQQRMTEDQLKDKFASILDGVQDRLKKTVPIKKDKLKKKEKK